MKLEVGKSYRTVKGKKVTIIFAEAVGINSGSPFKGDDDHWYTTEGRRHYVGAWRSHENDLLGEWEDK